MKFKTIDFVLLQSFFFCNQRKCLHTSANLNHPKYFRLNQWKICLRQLFFVDFWCSTSFSDIASEELNGHFSIKLFDWLTNFYRYLTKILISFTSEKQKLIHRLVGDEKSKVEINKFWDNVMSFNEWSLIIEENEKKYESSVAYLNPRIVSWTCISGMLSEALQQLKTIYASENLDLLSACELNERTHQNRLQWQRFFSFIY
jgi:hypothetical protein